MTSIDIATMRPEELDFAIELAAAEGWNPGLHDAAAFYAADPEGFLIGRVEGQPVGCISAVRYRDGLGFVGLYIVLPSWRGQGCGIALWRAAMARLAGCNVGLDGVPAQQANYRRSGFHLAYGNVRFERATPPSASPAQPGPMIGIVDIGRVPFATLCAFDRTHFGADRAAFLRHWTGMADAVALAALDGETLQGYGVIRRCRRGYKIGPLFSLDAGRAEALYLALCAGVPAGEPVYLDVPEVNRAGMRLAEKYAMQQVFGTARMYTGTRPGLPLGQVFGVTTFELG